MFKYGQFSEQGCTQNLNKEEEKMRETKLIRMWRVKFIFTGDYSTSQHVQIAAPLAKKYQKAYFFLEKNEEDTQEEDVVFLGALKGK